MPKHVTLSVPKPCHEDWNKMTPNEQGAFCSACRKTVIDFSNKTENEIFEILSKAEGKVCGRFTTMQLDRPIRKTEVHNTFNLRAIATSVGIMAYATNSVAGTSTLHENEQIQISVSDTTVLSASRPLVDSSIADKNVIVKGTVLSAFDGVPLTGAYMRLGPTGKGCVTDFDGSFHFTVKQSELWQYGDSLLLEAVDYQSIYWDICDYKETDTLDIRMFSNDFDMRMRALTVLGGVGAVFEYDTYEQRQKKRIIAGVTAVLNALKSKIAFNKTYYLDKRHRIRKRDI